LLNPRVRRLDGQARMKTAIGDQMPADRLLEGDLKVIFNLDRSMRTKVAMSHHLAGEALTSDLALMTAHGPIRPEAMAPCAEHHRPDAPSIKDHQIPIRMVHGKNALNPGAGDFFQRTFDPRKSLLKADLGEGMTRASQGDRDILLFIVRTRRGEISMVEDLRSIRGMNHPYEGLRMNPLDLPTIAFRHDPIRASRERTMSGEGFCRAGRRRTTGRIPEGKTRALEGAVLRMMVVQDRPSKATKGEWTSRDVTLEIGVRHFHQIVERAMDRVEMVRSPTRKHDSDRIEESIHRSRLSEVHREAISRRVGLHHDSGAHRGNVHRWRVASEKDLHALNSNNSAVPPPTLLCSPTSDLESMKARVVLMHQIAARDLGTSLQGRLSTDALDRAHHHSYLINKARPDPQCDRHLGEGILGASVRLCAVGIVRVGDSSDEGEAGATSKALRAVRALVRARLHRASRAEHSKATRRERGRARLHRKMLNWVP
jgi:hypothetical protein